jgi:hypothetical protein
MPTLPMLDRSLLVRTDFSNDTQWQQLIDEAQRENEDGFHAYIEPVNDPAFDGASWEAVKAAVPADDDGVFRGFDG